MLVQPSRTPHWISKKIALGSYEFLAMLEGKTRKGLPILLGLNLVKYQCV